MSEKAIQIYIGKKLKQLREAADLKQREVAKKINKNPDQVSQHELGNTMPSITTLRKYCELYNVTSSEILPF